MASKKAQKWHPFQNPKVAALFETYPTEIRERLLILRQMIFDVAANTPGVGKIEETLKWGQPSYVTSETKSGTTIRLDQVKAVAGEYAIYAHCQTPIIDNFRQMYGKEFKFEKNRAIHFDESDKIPVKKMREFIKMALTYHLDKHGQK